MQTASVFFWSFAKKVVNCAKFIGMDNSSVISRVRYLMGELRLRQNSFAARIGCDVTNLSKQLNGKLPITDSFINKIVVNTGVSKEWLVSGDSMAPVINNGDYIAVREVSDTSIIYWGQIYVVLLDDYRMVKYLRRHPDDSKVVLRSANPAYDDIDVPKSAIRGLFFVSKIVKVVDAG